MVHPEELNGREFDGGSIHKGVQDERALLELCESRMHGQGLPLTRSEAESRGGGNKYLGHTLLPAGAPHVLKSTGFWGSGSLCGSQTSWSAQSPKLIVMIT